MRKAAISGSASDKAVPVSRRISSTMGRFSQLGEIVADGDTRNETFAKI